jgi:hypothetical protein
MSDNKFYCEVCKKTFSNISALNKHFKTESHLKRELEKEDEGEDYQHKENKGKREKKEVAFFCPLCDYETKRLNDIEKHIKSKGHQNAIETYKSKITNQPKNAINMLNDPYQLNIGLVKDYDDEKEKEVMVNITTDDIFDKFNLLDSEGEPKIMKNAGVSEKVLERREKDRDRKEMQEKQPKSQKGKEEQLKKQIETLKDKIFYIKKNEEIYNEKLKKYNKYLENPSKNKLQLSPDVMIGKAKRLSDIEKFKKLDEYKNKLNELKNKLEKLES